MSTLQRCQTSPVAQLALACPGYREQSHHSTQHSTAQSQTSAPSPGLGPELHQPQLQARSRAGSFQVVLRKAGAVHHCVPSWLESSVRKRGKKGPFFHLLRHLVVSSNIIKLTIFKCFVTSVILQLSTEQEVILLLPASLDTARQSATTSFKVQSPPWDLQEQLQFKPAR